MPGKLRILVVDDSPTARNMTCSVVQTLGHKADTAQNGMEALNVLRSEAFDMVISDVLMPVLDGYGLCLEMKKDVRLKTLPLIFVSDTYTLSQDREFGLYIGAEAYFMKPMKKEELLECLNNFFTHGFIEKPQLFSQSAQSDLKEYSAAIYKTYNSLLIKKLEEQLSEREKAEQKLNTLLTLSSLANETINEEKYLEKTLHVISRYCSAKGCGIYLLEQNGLDLTLSVHMDLPDFYLETLSEIEVGFSFAGKTAAQGKFLSFTVEEIESKTLRMIFEKNEVRLIGAFPILSEQGVLGVVLILFHENTPLSQYQSDLLMSFGRQIGNRLAKQKLSTMIHQSREKLKAIFDSIEDPIYVINKDHRITSANKMLASRLKLSPRKMVGTPCYQTLWGRQTPCEDCPLQPQSNFKTIRKVDTPAGKTKTLELKASPVKNQSLVVEEYILIEKDLTAFMPEKA